jgi:hypothetical protein
MDPFSALGLASNVVSFVDFSCKLFSKAREIYSSASGQSQEVEDLTTIAEHIRGLSSRISPVPLPDPREFHVPESDRRLNELAYLCGQAASDLLDALEKVRARAPKSKWESFRAVLVMVMSQEKINSLEERLEKYRRQVIMALEVIHR